MYFTNPCRHIGKNQLASLAPFFAQICQFENSQGHKAHGKRAFGITLLSNSSVAKLRVSRYTNMKTHTRYQRLIDKNIEKYKVMNPLLHLNAPVDETQSVMICSPTESTHTESIMQTIFFLSMQSCQTLINQVFCIKIDNHILPITLLSN